jgi:hypothetical protein
MKPSSCSTALFPRHRIYKQADQRKCKRVHWKNNHHCWVTKNQLIYIHTYLSCFIPEGVAEASQIFLQDTHVLPKYLATLLVTYS